MNPDVRGAKALAVGGADVVPADQVSRAAVAVDQMRHLEPVRGQAWTQPELLEEAGAVGRERHRRTHLPQFGRLLEDVGRNAVSAQGDGQREAPDPGADDGNAALVRCAHDGPDCRASPVQGRRRERAAGLYPRYTCPEHPRYKGDGS
jgi:hypothetical protein